MRSRTTRNSQKRFKLGMVFAALLSAFLFYERRNPRLKKKTKAWVNRMKRDVLKEVQHLDSLSRSAYDKAVNTVVARYQQYNTVDKKELDLVAEDVRRCWDQIRIHHEERIRTRKKK
jgi:hypothetical protein